jgi:ribosomal protein L37AE/L43A
MNIGPYLTTDPNTISPAPKRPDPVATTPTSDRPPEGNVCEGCHLSAGQLRRIGDGPWHCEGCHERAADEARKKAYEPIRRQQEAEMEAFRERQHEEARRAPNPDFVCSFHSDHGRAVFLVEGLMVCRKCAEAMPSTFDRGGQHTLTHDSPILALEAQVAELKAAVAALQAPKASRKAVG